MNVTSLIQRHTQRAQKPNSSQVHLQVEALEDRLTPYAVTGNAWPHPELVTLSFVPDGTNLGGPSSDLFARFNAAFGSTSAWQNTILRAAQTWAVQTDLNFSVVTDAGGPSGSGSYQQGASDMGDIRIGGFNFYSSALAMAFMPPPANNYSIAGDFSLNTGYAFTLNGLPFDLFTVSLHEMGHSLGLGHAAPASSVMYPSYNGADSGLSADDIDGIRAIYSNGAGRSQDLFDAVAANGTFATASNLDGYVDPVTGAGLLERADVTSTTDMDYYVLTAPTGATQLTVTVQSQGLSLLAPSLRLFDSTQRLLAFGSVSGSLGGTVTRTITVTPGQQFYVRVNSATSSPFGVGAYGMTFNFGSGSAPTIPLPDTQTPNGDPLHSEGGIPDRPGRRLWGFGQIWRPPRSLAHDERVEVLSIENSFYRRNLRQILTAAQEGQLSLPSGLRTMLLADAPQNGLFSQTWQGARTLLAQALTQVLTEQSELLSPAFDQANLSSTDENLPAVSAAQWSDWLFSDVDWLNTLPRSS